MALVAVNSYRDPIEAELAIVRLEQSGISATLVDQYLASIQWLYSNAIGGVKVMVEDSDLDAARNALDEERAPEPNALPEPTNPEIPEVRCPSCDSEEIHASRLQRNAAAISLLLSLPLIAWRNSWICNVCGHSWRRPPTVDRKLSCETLEAEEFVHERTPYPIFRVVFAAVLGLVALYYIQSRISQPFE
jgi:hypothetical protein